MKSKIKRAIQCLLRLLLPRPILLKLKKERYQKKGWPLSPDDIRLLGERAELQGKPGVTLFGYVSSGFGLGQSVRNYASSLAEIEKLSWEIYDYEIGNHSQKGDLSWKTKLTESPDYDISLIHVNADQMPLFYTMLPSKIWKTYKIGIWYWELEHFPAEWDSSFNLVDELWAPTHFIENALKEKANCPVIYMPPSIELPTPSPKYNRNYFSLPEDSFLFLSMYDLFSISERKNPKAAILAFQEAFAPDDFSVGLVLKVNNTQNAEPEIEKLKELMGDYRNIYCIFRTLPREEVNGLLCACNAAVSLHRSEGLGLLCQEAMYYKKPVIATGWSGNTDFTREGNSCLVDYKLIELSQDYGPYQKGQRWAEADIHSAAEEMKRLASDTEYYQKIAENAYQTIITDYSPSVCASRMEERLNQIRNKIKN